jgi:hypothetical protein
MEDVGKDVALVLESDVGVVHQPIISGVESSLVLSPTRFLHGPMGYSIPDRRPHSSGSGIVNLPIDSTSASPWPPRDEVNSRGKII